MTKGLRSIRALSAESLRGVTASPNVGPLPKVEFVDPKTLYVEDAYQRSMQGSNSTGLVRKIVGGFSWARFKPPICVRLPDFGNVLVVVDGQHTVTAAASHGKIPKIPVLVVPAATVENRAQAFVGHNRDRIGLTRIAIYRAELAHHDPLALSIERACEKSGAFILPGSVSLKQPQEPGATIAIGTMRQLAKNQGEEVLARVLSVLVKAKRGPIKAQEIAAAALTLAGVDVAVDERLAKVIGDHSAERWSAMASSFTADTNVALPIALATMWRQELGLSRPTRTLKASGNAAKNVLEEQRVPDKVAAPPREQVESTRFPKPAVEVKQAPAKPAGIVVERNGIVVDTAAGTVSHRRSTIRLPPEEIKLIASLASVAPSLLLYDRLSVVVFGTSVDGRLKLSRLIDRLNPALVKARLEVKTVARLGHSLADLGPAAV